jgi:tetratricopeptide (TPR) repeat protein
VNAPADMSASPESGQKAFRRQRIWALLVSLLMLLVFLWYVGGLAGFPRMMVYHSLGKQDFDRARWWTSTAESLSYHDPANALLAARIARLQGDAERWRQALARAKVWGANPSQLRLEQLLLQAQSGQIEGIEAELMQALGVAGGEGAEISEAYANGLASLGRFAEALQLLEAWRTDFPEDPRPDHRIGRIQEHQQRYDEAEASYRRSIARDADYFPGHYSLGRVLMHQRRTEEAARHFHVCLRMPAPEAAQVELAVALKAMGKADEARPLFQQALAAGSLRIQDSYSALEEKPEGFRAAAEYGKLESDAGNFAAAEPWLAAALSENPLDLMTRYSLAVSLRGLGKKKEADEQFAKVGAARSAMGAAGALNARIQRDPRDLEARLRLGKLILEHESERAGLYWIRSIFSFEPDYRPAHEFLAEYFAKRSDTDQASAPLARYHRQRAESITAAADTQP